METNGFYAEKKNPHLFIERVKCGLPLAQKLEEGSTEHGRLFRIYQ